MSTQANSTPGQEPGVCPQCGDRVRKRGRTIEGFVSTVLSTGTIKYGVMWDRSPRGVAFYSEDEIEVIA